MINIITMKKELLSVVGELCTLKWYIAHYSIYAVNSGNILFLFFYNFGQLV